jgi:hypothetical protein
MSNIEEIPKIEDYMNIHKGEDIYILASGKSVDFLHKSFYDNKIIIGVNQVYKKITCKYLLRKECKLIKEVIKNNPNTTHFISKGECGLNNIRNYEYIKNYISNKNNIVIYSHNINRIKIPRTFPPEHSLVVSYSTITTAIHLAAYMGAKNIILVGHDGGLINNECNFSGYHTDATYKIIWPNGGKNHYKKWLSNIDNDTIILKILLKRKYNCNICSINPFINFNLEGNKYTRT